MQKVHVGDNHAIGMDDFATEVRAVYETLVRTPQGGNGCWLLAVTVQLHQWTVRPSRSPFRLLARGPSRTNWPGWSVS